MKHLAIICFVSMFLIVLGQVLFSQRPASSGEEAIMLSLDMRRGEQQQYLLEQSKMFYRQGRFEDAVSLIAYVQEHIGIDSPEVRELFRKSRQQLEERAMTETEKLQQPLQGMADAP